MKKISYFLIIKRKKKRLDGSVIRQRETQKKTKKIFSNGHRQRVYRRVRSK